jgi:50S ribosomal subunit-associated GTPase HflX
MQVLLTDTVGFIQKLPTQLVAAFRATLEEITEASLLLHVVDVSHPNAAAQTQAVMQVVQMSETCSFAAPLSTARFAPKRSYLSIRHGCVL